MWYREISIAELTARDRWKVEFFDADSIDRLRSAFELLPLSSLLEERTEKLQPQDFPEHTFNYLGLANVESLTGDLIDFRPQKGRDIRSTSKVFYEGDILYGRLRPYLNKVFLAADSVRVGICSGEFYVFRVNDGMMLPHYMRTILASTFVQQRVRNLYTGSALPRLPLEELLSIDVPVPPLSVQVVYEQYLIHHTELRRLQMAELREYPHMIISSLMSSIRDGRSEIQLSTSSTNLPYYENPLPVKELQNQPRRENRLL